MLHDEFLYSLKPVAVEENAPRIVKMMAEAGSLVNVGPMAAVAGSLADLAVEAMLSSEAEVAIVEDGGEVSASSKEAFIIGLYAGKNILSGSIGFKIQPSECPIGVATSSATVSHVMSFSFGEADAATVITDKASLADASGVAICNAVRGEDEESSVQSGLDAAERIRDLIRGALIIRGKYAGTIGKIPQLVKISQGIDIRQVTLLDISPDMILL